MVRLDGKVAMITGGASGIGEASVRLFVESGAKVLIADIQDKRGKRIAEKLGAKYIHLNVSCEEDVITGVDNALSCYGRLDCLFNNIFKLIIIFRTLEHFKVFIFNVFEKTCVFNFIKK